MYYDRDSYIMFIYINRDDMWIYISMYEKLIKKLFFLLYIIYIYIGIKYIFYDLYKLNMY